MWARQLPHAVCTMSSNRHRRVESEAEKAEDEGSWVCRHNEFLWTLVYNHLNACAFCCDADFGATYTDGVVGIYGRVGAEAGENIEEHKEIVTQSFLKQKALQLHQWKYSCYVFSPLLYPKIFLLSHLRQCFYF